MVARTYEDAAALVRSAARFGIHPSLDTITALAGALDDPQDTFRVVQVAGTNGKTSVARVTAAILGAQGERTGLFTSPTLGRLADQVEIDGRALTREAYAAGVDAVAEASDRLGVEPTEFEFTTAIALWAMREARVSWGVLEVGMGGRWDATSVSKARVATITGVDIDHAEHLGPTREAIAAEKAQIISSRSRVVLGPGVSGVLEVFLARAQHVDAAVSIVTEAPVAGDSMCEVIRPPDEPGGEMEFSVLTTRYRYDKLVMRAPSFQALNAAIAIASAEAALGRQLDAVKLRGVLAAMPFPGRFEVIANDPAVIADGAHNPAAAEVLARAIAESLGQTLPTVVIGVLEDKDALGIVGALAPVVRGFVATESASERAVPAEKLADVIEGSTGTRPQMAGTVAEAIDVARSASGAPVVATGSLTVAAEARRALDAGWAE